VKYVTEKGSAAMIVLYIPNFIKIGSGSQTLMGGFTETQIAWRSHKATSRKQAKTRSS
jgi:hypothetical protein